MDFANPRASVFVPGDGAQDAAAGRVTHLAVGAHQDDIEIMAFDGVVRCFQKADAAFGAVVVTDGSGSPRAGRYASFSDAQMRAIRQYEQRKAAIAGNYAVLVEMNYSSAEAKEAANRSLARDLRGVVEACRPSVVYTHNLADKHDTHVAVALATVRALRALPPGARPRQVLGCEVWRGLDWLADEDKVALDVTGHDSLAAALIGVHDSQVAGGKRYDLATLGRRRANATYFESHAVDRAEAITFAMDLTPLVTQPDLDVAEFLRVHLDKFRQDVLDRVRRFSA